jgi:hypothetical protein
VSEEYWQEKCATLSRLLDESESKLDDLEKNRANVLAARDHEMETSRRLLEKLKAAESRLHNAELAVSMFAGVIKSGEPWTPTCEAALRNVLAVERQSREPPPLACDSPLYCMKCGSYLIGEKPVERRDPIDGLRVCQYSLMGHAGDPCPKCGSGPCQLMNNV